MSVDDGWLQRAALAIFIVSLFGRHESPFPFSPPLVLKDTLRLYYYYLGKWSREGWVPFARNFFQKREGELLLSTKKRMGVVALQQWKF